MEQNKPKTFEELFKETDIKPTVDENGTTHWNFKAKLNNMQDTKQDNFYDIFNMSDEEMKKELDKLNMGKWREMVQILTSHNGNYPNLHGYSLEGEILQIVIHAIKANSDI